METFQPTNQPQESITPKLGTQERIPHVEKMKGVMARIALEVNKEVEEKYGLKGLVDESLHIDPAFFAREKGGIYSEDEIFDDEGTVYALDRYNSSADNEGVQAHYKEKYGIDTPEDIVAKHREIKEASKANQAEMVITALLHKVLKEKFLVVRSAMFDDYKHGIDNLILDKETGAVICAFDEVIENVGDRERGASKKIEKIKKIAVKGGTEAKYGIALRGEALTRAHPRNIPVFYLTLEGKDLIELTDLLSREGDTLTEAEQRLYAHLVGSIKEQKEMLEKLNLPAVMKRSLQGFESSLATLESFVDSNK